MPYTLILDLGSAKPAKGMYFVPRATGGQVPKDIEVFKSDNNTDWVSIGTFQIGSGPGVRNNYNFPATITNRYYKIIIKNNWSNNSDASLAELNIIQP
ncbi:F5/8 type C domain protein [compost metagenome]